jgi:hypothetical protein
VSVTTHVLYYECGCVILLMKVVLVYYCTTVCAYSMYVTQYVCMLYVYLLLLWRVCVLVYHSLFLLKYGSLGENIFRGVWNKAQALVYVVFSVRVLLILM